MFNSYFPPVVVEVKYAIPRIRICETLVLDGENYTVKLLDKDEPLVPPEIIAAAVTPIERAKVGRISPSANNFLSPSLETMQAVAKTLEVIDNKFSYEAAMEKITAAHIADINKLTNSESNNENNNN